LGFIGGVRSLFVPTEEAIVAVEIQIQRAAGLAKADTFGLSDPYAVVHLLPLENARATGTRKGSSTGRLAAAVAPWASNNRHIRGITTEGN
jgi:hypothetical protein